MDSLKRCRFFTFHIELFPNILISNLYLSVAPVKDLARGHVTEMVVILLPDLTITDALPPSPMARDDLPRHTVPLGVRIVTWSAGEVYPQAVAEMKVTDRDLPEIRVVMVWDERQCVEEVDIQRLLIAVVDQWTTDEGEIHPHLDSMRIEAEELPVGGESEVSVAGSMCCYKTHVKRKWSFFSFFDGDFAPIFGRIVSIIVKTLRNTSSGASRCFKTKKT